MYAPFFAEIANPLSPLTTVSTIELVGKHKKMWLTLDATSEGDEQATAPL